MKKNLNMSVPPVSTIPLGYLTMDLRMEVTAPTAVQI